MKITDPHRPWPWVILISSHGLESDLHWKTPCFPYHSQDHLTDLTWPIVGVSDPGSLGELFWRRVYVCYIQLQATIRKRLRGNAWEIQSKSGICGNLSVMFSNNFPALVSAPRLVAPASPNLSVRSYTSDTICNLSIFMMLRFPSVPRFLRQCLLIIILFLPFSQRNTWVILVHARVICSITEVCLSQLSNF